MPAHTCSHTLAIRGTQLLVLTSPRDGCTRGASLPPAEPPRARPPPHTARAFQTHPGSHPPAPWQTLAPEPPITAPHRSLPRGPRRHSPALVCVHTRTAVTQTLSSAPNQNTPGLTYGYQHTLRTATLPHRQHSTSRNSDPCHPQPLPLAVGNTDTHSERSVYAGIPGCLACASGWPKAGRERFLLKTEETDNYFLFGSFLS